jgi:phosphatidate cytidylyltransferase
VAGTSTEPEPVDESRASDVPAGPSPEEPDATPVARTSRAGRNLPAAIAVGALLGGGVLVALLTVRQVFVGIVAVAVAVATVELAGALKRGAGISVALWPVLAGGQAMVWLAWPFERDGVFAAFVVTVLVCLVWRFQGGAVGYLRDVTASIFTAAYVPLFAAFAAMLVVAPDGRDRVLCFLIIVVSSDTCGYIAGASMGRHPMAPSISPKKSWEGFAGSMTGGVVAGALCLTLLLPGQWWQGMLFGAALVATATVGDLTESLIKRDLKIKDMGQLLPGHGGLMDRLDSLLPSAVVSWLLLSLFVPV